MRGRHYCMAACDFVRHFILHNWHDFRQSAVQIVCFRPHLPPPPTSILISLHRPPPSSSPSTTHLHSHLLPSPSPQFSVLYYEQYVPPGTHASFLYSFVPSEMFVARTLGLVISVYYKTAVSGRGGERRGGEGKGGEGWVERGYSVYLNTDVRGWNV